MAENFYEMYLEEMELIRPLDQEEESQEGVEDEEG